jgi:hypothetical protein
MRMGVRDREWRALYSRWSRPARDTTRYVSLETRPSSHSELIVEKKKKLRAEFEMLAEAAPIDPRRSGKLCMERASSR